MTTHVKARIAVPDLPRAYPLVGHLPQFLADKLGFLMRCASRGPQAVELRIGEPTLLLRDAEDIRHVLVTGARTYEKSDRLVGTRGRRLYGEGLMTLPGQTHLERRRALAPMFRREAVERFAEVTVRAACHTTRGWRDGVEVELDAAMADLAERIMTEVLLGLDAAAQERVIGDAVRQRRRYIEYAFGSLLPWAERWPLPVNFRYRRAARRLDRVVYDRIAHERDRAAAGLGSSGSLLAALLDARTRDGLTLSDLDVHDEALILSVAGYETTGEWLAWTLYLLALHADVHARVCEELDCVLGRADQPTAAQLWSLVYTQRALAESLRLYPPTWIFVRVARAEDRLPSGACVRAGMKLYLCSYLVHRDPRYFPDPERFDPERFGAEACAARPALAYFPFGAGPRLCIGESLARLEAVAALAMIARSWAFELVPGQTVVPEPGVTLKPRHGIRVRLRKV